MKLIYFEFYLLISFEWININCQLNIYNTDRTNENKALLEYDCLNYEIRQEKFACEDLWDVIDEIIPFCIRPEDISNVSIELILNPHSKKITFEELRLNNITFEELVLWSIPYNIIERYDFYIDFNDQSLSNEYINNCSNGWFGDYCQYSFEYNQSMNFNQIVKDAFNRRESYSELSQMAVNIPCYVLLKCTRNGKSWCLDWREICDGKIDCFDNGEDEENCFNMEMNECKENEFRCYNGLCISHDLWNDGYADCLDRSDEIQYLFNISSCYQDPTFSCEEHSCKSLDHKSFSCGNGQCVMKFDKCHNGRHRLLFESMITKGNLSDECWIAMICGTALSKEINQSFCQIELFNKSMKELFQKCDSLFQFPSMPIYSNHVRLFYEIVHLKESSKNFLLPDYICYNDELCDLVGSNIDNNDHVNCLQYNKLFPPSEIRENSWSDLYYLIEKHFHVCSSSSDVIFHMKINSRNDSSLYQCENSSKIISKHRILDGISDCFANDDEEYLNESCQLNHSYRVKCLTDNQCWSPLFKLDFCLFNQIRNQQENSFEKFCNNINQNYTNYTQSKCQQWCDNIYTRCDGFWSCLDGRDERNCTQTKCPLGTYQCISSENYTTICLSAERVNDRSVIDCLGAADEQEDCRFIKPNSPYRFQCKNSSTCILSSQLCDQNKDCPSADDQEFCGNITFSCDNNIQRNRTNIEELLCGLSEWEYHKISYFSLHTSLNYPALENDDLFNETIDSTIKDIDVYHEKNISWPWFCNRGIPIRSWIDNNTYEMRCICPPSYYGNSCEYENERISLSLRLSSSDRNEIYSIIIMLIDDNDEKQNIDAFHQFIFTRKEICTIKLNRYLLYPTRPKNLSKNYSIRIDTFNKKTLQYSGSWFYPILFRFLPVNRLSISLFLSNYRIEILSNCSIVCINGFCNKYINENKFFCRCHSNWSGISCHIPINCQTCLFKSLCLGLSFNQSVCLCPLHRFGSKCSLTSTTCSNNQCLNKGECIGNDLTIPSTNLICLCPFQYFGRYCQYVKSRVDVSLINMDVPSYIRAYFFLISNRSKPLDTIILRKLTLFQRSVTFHLSMSYNLAIFQVNHKFYIGVLQKSPKRIVSTSISPSEECIELLNSSLLNMSENERIGYYYDLCWKRFDIKCFIDDLYLCLCTSEHHANCFKFNKKIDLKCLEDNQCENGGKCLEDHSICPSTKICLCKSCYFGDKCQFYGKGLGLTLDQILAYEFKSNRILLKQPLIIQISGALTIIIFLIAILNIIPSIIIFLRENSEVVGCRIYILASLISALLVMILFLFKFFFLYLSYQDKYGNDLKQTFILINCKIIELLLKISLYVNNWLNACVSIERSISVSYGALFNKNKSKKYSKIITILLPIIITSLFIPQIIHIHIFTDKFEEKSWCVMNYSSLLQNYSLFLILLNYFIPLIINLFSTLFIIITTTRQNLLIQPDRTLLFHFKSKIKQYRYIIIGPFIIILLTAPHLIIALTLNCDKSFNSLRSYLIAYFISFIPSASMFVIYVIPSSFYLQTS